MAADPKFIFFDCDDTLYRNDWKTGDRLTQKIAQYTERIGRRRRQGL